MTKVCAIALACATLLLRAGDGIRRTATGRWTATRRRRGSRSWR